MSSEPGPCYCLCAVNHPDVEGICTGQRDDEIEFWTDVFRDETVMVSMCSPCIEATRAHRASEP